MRPRRDMMKTRTRLTLSAAIASLPLATPVSAQEAFLLDEITVHSHLVPIETTRTGTSVSVVDAADLEAAGNILVSDYLDHLPGVSVVRQGPAGTVADIRIRGAHQRYTATYIDG